MTVSSTTNRKSFAGDDVTVAFGTSPVVFFDDTDLEVYLVTTATGASTLQTLTTHYTVSGGAGSTGTVTMVTAPASTETLVILRVLPLTQTDDFVNNEINDAEVLEDRLDRLTMIDQQLDERQDRALQIAVGETLGDDIVTTGKAGYYLRRNAAGTDFEMAVGDANDSTFTQSGTGAVERSVTAKLAEVVSVKDFGATGDGSTDDTAAIQTAIDYISDYTDDSGVQGILLFPKGSYKVTAPIIMGKNVTLIGDGLRFSTNIVPAATFSGAALFRIEGSLMIGGFAFYASFKNLCIDETNVTSTEVPIVFNLDTAYSCTFEDVYVRNGVGTIFKIEDCNDIKIIRPRIFGLSTSVCNFGIRAVAGSSVTVVDPDVELCAAGIAQETNCTVTVLGGYGERNTRAWYNNGSSSGSMTVVGGLWQGVNSGTIAAEAKGGNCTVIGGRYTANGGSGLSVGLSGTKPVNVNFVGVAGDITDAKNWATKNFKSDPSGVHKTNVLNYKQVSDNTATTLFRVTVPNAAANWGTLKIKVSAKLTSSGFTGYYGEWVVAFSVASSAIQTGSPTEVATMAYANSANYSLAMSITGSASIPNLDIQVTANSGGALGNGDTVEIMAEAELIQALDTGAVYIAAQ